MLSETENRIDFKLLLQKNSNFYKREYVILSVVLIKLHILSIDPLKNTSWTRHNCYIWDMTDLREVSSQAFHWLKTLCKNVQTTPFFFFLFASNESYLHKTVRQRLLVCETEQSLYVFVQMESIESYMSIWLIGL